MNKALERLETMDDLKAWIEQQCLASIAQKAEMNARIDMMELALQALARMVIDTQVVQKREQQREENNG